jgi:hypothetical protein
MDQKRRSFGATRTSNLLLVRNDLHFQLPAKTQNRTESHTTESIQSLEFCDRVDRTAPWRILRRAQKENGKGRGEETGVNSTR